MKSKEQHEDFNIKLMQILNKIEMKLDKESGSRKSVIHRPPYEKRRTITIRKHHHQSLRHSNKREHNS
jgi:hypothetical protein